jgi:hypothetical protein
MSEESPDARIPVVLEEEPRLMELRLTCIYCGGDRNVFFNEQTGKAFDFAVGESPENGIPYEIRPFNGVSLSVFDIMTLLHGQHNSSLHPDHT